MNVVACHVLKRFLAIFLQVKISIVTDSLPAGIPTKLKSHQWAAVYKFTQRAL